MGLKEQVNAFVQNAVEMYKLYDSLKLDGKNGLVKKEIKKTPLFTCLSFLLEKEKEYEESLEREMTESLITECNNLWSFIPIQGGQNRIEHYIENESYVLPYLRVIQRIVDLLENREEVADYSREEEESDTKTIEKQTFKSTSETVLDEFYPELEEQYTAHLINIAFKNKALYKDTPYENICNQLIKDFIYLSKNLESYFIYDMISNMPYTLLLVEDLYPNYFQNIGIGRAAILDDIQMILKRQLVLLSSKKTTHTNKVAFLRCLYMEMLCEELDEETIEAFLENNGGILETIDYDFPILKEWRRIIDTFYLEEKEEQKVKK